MYIKAFAEKLVRSHGTRDPVRIIDNLGYILIETPLMSIRGFYQYTHRYHIIYVDNGLSQHEKHWVCAHELGHALLHKRINRIFMDAHTHMVTNRFERDADKFAADLLFDDSDLQDFLECSIVTVAKCLGISCEIAEYRMSSVNPCFKIY